MTRSRSARAIAGTCLAALIVGPTLGGQTTAPSRLPRNADEFDALFQQVKNWGRWGPNDQLGAANLVTEAKRRQAAGTREERVDRLTGAQSVDRKRGRTTRARSSTP